MISVILDAGFLAYLAWDEGSRGDSVSMIIKRQWHEMLLPAAMMADKVFTITCIFLGQVGDSSGGSYRKGKVAIIQFTLWFFVNLFLMVNFYQGFIYSCLTILYPPRTPRGVDELVDLDIQVVANDTYTMNSSRKTYLSDFDFTLDLDQITDICRAH